MFEFFQLLRCVILHLSKSIILTSFFISSIMLWIFKWREINVMMMKFGNGLP
jgi:hypothetical protein